MANSGASDMNEQEKNVLRDRIKELGDKATQLLTFLSFAIAAALILADHQNALGPCQKVALKWAIRSWVFAFFPILINVLPVKEIFGKTPAGLERIRFWKVVLLWLAVGTIFFGVIAFLCAIW